MCTWHILHAESNGYNIRCHVLHLLHKQLIVPVGVEDAAILPAVTTIAVRVVHGLQQSLSEGCLAWLPPAKYSTKPWNSKPYTTLPGSVSLGREWRCWGGYALGCSGSGPSTLCTLNNDLVVAAFGFFQALTARANQAGSIKGCTH